jgi:hypothetical protein
VFIRLWKTPCSNISYLPLLPPESEAMMALRFGRRIPNWILLVAGSTLVATALGIAAVTKPVPEYLVAAAALKPGAPLSATDLKTVPLDLGETAASYVLAEDLPPGVGVSRVVRQGELLSKADLTFELDQELTSIRFIPKLKPSVQVKPGSQVSVWKVVETETGQQVQQLVARAEVLDLVYGEGLFAAEFPEVEIRITWEQSALLLQAVTAESDIYLLPLP